MTLVERVQTAIDKAEKGESNLDAKVFGVCGLTGTKVRHLLNNLCEGETNYLEIGSFKGATMCSALYGNPQAKGTGIEGFFEEYGTVSGKKYLADNINRVLGDKAPVIMIVGDSFTDNIHEATAEYGPYDVFLYDGHHGESQTTIGITQYAKMMKSEFVLIVDDWCHPDMEKDVRSGTFRALASSDLIVEKSWERWTMLGGNDDYYSGWWYGLYIAVVKKNG